MKNKILFNLFLLAGLGLIYVTMSSSDNGIYNGGNNCGGCHGGASTSTTVLLDGVPSNYQIGQTYSFTVTVINPGKTQAGFNVKATGGTFNAGTGSKTNTAKSEITHTAPKVISGGNASFSFSWTAPTTTAVSSVTFSVAGNAVNGDGNANTDGSDQWNTITSSVTLGAPASVEADNLPVINCYPNPVHDQVRIDGGMNDMGKMVIYNSFGQIMSLSPVQSNSGLTIDCSQLTPGNYYITGVLNGKQVHTAFIKD